MITRYARTDFSSRSGNLAQCNIEIAALSETWLADEGQLTEVGTGYTFFSSGKQTVERRDSGVGIAIKYKLVNHLPSIP